MSFPEFKGLGADHIAKERYVEDSAWHIHQCLAWLDFAIGQQAPMTLHYAGLHLRTGIEFLWLELFGAASGGAFSKSRYREAIRNTTKLYKLIDEATPHYEKFAEFHRLMASLDSVPHPPTAIWDIPRLKRIHGGCGELLLHFQGILVDGYLGSEWIENRSRFIHDSAGWMWSVMTTRGNLVVYRPDGLKKPEVFSLWERYRDGIDSAEDARNGLRIVQDIVRRRPAPPG